MRLLIRADASTRMGTGHVMRCMALGQAWREAGGAVEFLTRCEGGALVDRLLAEGMIVSRLQDGADWPALEAAVRSAGGAAALVLDGYQFDTDYQRKARGLCRPLIAIDDTAHLPFYAADMVLNQNIDAGELRYAVEPGTQLLLGCRWALLRKQQP